MAGRIEIVNAHGSKRVSVAIMERLARRVMRLIGKEGRADLEIVFVGDAAIRKLNKRYKAEDRATDVLSFGIDATEFGRSKLLGEIFISLDTAQRNAAVFGAALEEEIILYVIHGILHLFGYDDTTRVKARRMAARQDAIMRKVCRKETLSRVLTRR